MALFLFGTVLWVVSAFLPNHPHIETRLEAAGLSIVITTAVTILLNWSFESRVYNSFQIIRGCQGAGILRIFCNRKEANEEIDRLVTTTLSRIDILAIAGRDLLFPDHPVLEQIGHWIESNARPKIRILLLDPRSRHAVERSMREHGVKALDHQTTPFKYSERDLCKDIVLSLQQMESKLELSAARGIPDFDLEVRTYDSPPFFLSVRLDDRVFIEQYHLGLAIDEENKSIRKFLGRRVPVIEASVISDLGQIVVSHFDYLWLRSAGRKFKVGCLSVLQRSLESSDWASRFEQETLREDEEFASSNQAAVGKAKAKSAGAGSANDQSGNPSDIS
jgi:hypothetical protein